MKTYKPHLLFLLLASLLLSDSNKIELGRDSDPRTVNDISKFKLLYKKTFWSSISILGPRNISKLAYPKAITHMKAVNAVAFTIDDGFCGVDNPNGDMLEDVRQLLDKYNAHATFFVTGSHTYHSDPDDIENLLIDGHELANHNMYDMPYNKLSKSEFHDDLNYTNSILKKYTDDISSWYRPPHAKISKNMYEIIDKNDLKFVLGDVFANDTAIPDPYWIAKYILNKVKPGSIIIIHMPEKGVREWNYKAMDLILDGLSKKGLDILTLSELDSLKSN